VKQIVIVGSGLAGYTLAREFRKLDSSSSLTLITTDDGSFYSKPMLSNALAKNKSAADLPSATAEKMAQDLDARIITHTHVEHIDAKAHHVVTAQETLTYDKLVLALGAQPILLPIEGDAAQNMLTVNDLDDYARFRQAIESVEHVAIIGPGLIGCEFANDLCSAGYKVSVIGPDEMPLGRLLPTEVGTRVKQALQQQGVDWYLETVVQRIDTQQNERLRLTLANGESVITDVVLSAIGLRPNTVLATTASLRVERGIVVDQHLTTSDADIYALGDCAEVAGLVLPYVMPIMQAARALAKTLAGEATKVRYPAMPVVVKTPAMPLVVSPPAPNVKGEWRIEASETGVRARYLDSNDALLGFVLAGDAVQEKQSLSKSLPAVLD